MKTDIEFTISAIGLMYESFVLSSPSKIQSSLERGMLQTFWDVPKLTYQALLPNQQRLHMNVVVPAGAKACYLGFMRG